MRASKGLSVACRVFRRIVYSTAASTRPFQWYSDCIGEEICAHAASFSSTRVRASVRAESSVLTVVSTIVSAACSFVGGRLMRRIFFVLLLVLPLLDVWLTREFAHHLGSPVWLWFVLPAVVGVLLIRHEGLSFRARFMAALTGTISHDTNPWRSVLNSARKVAAGVLFILPGVLSDIAAMLFLLLPFNMAARLVPAFLPSAAHAPRAGRSTLEGSYRRID